VRRAVERAERVAHLAAVVGVRRVCERPLETWTVNATGSENVLRAAAELGRPTLLASSSEVYGCSPSVPFREDQPLSFGSPEIPRWSYAASKAAAESLALALHREAGLPVRIVRFFNTSGPRQSPESGMVLPRLVDRALRGAPLELYGDGRQSRCFCHVRDAVEAVARLLREERAAGQVFNVGTDREVRLEDLARLVLERTGSNSAVVTVPYAQAFGPGFVDLRRRVPDLERLERTVGFRAATPLEQLVDDVAADLRACPRPLVG
jgi:UDP-glucose 4-epimerase